MCDCAGYDIVARERCRSHAKEKKCMYSIFGQGSTLYWRIASTRAKSVHARNSFYLNDYTIWLYLIGAFFLNATTFYGVKLGCVPYKHANRSTKHLSKYIHVSRTLEYILEEIAYRISKFHGQLKLCHTQYGQIICDNENRGIIQFFFEGIKNKCKVKCEQNHIF